MFNIVKHRKKITSLLYMFIQITWVRY